MPIYVPLALTAAFCFSLNGVFLKIASKHQIKNKYTLLFYSYLTALLFLPVIPFLTKIQNPLRDFGPLFLYSLTFFIGNFYFYTVLFQYDISILQPFFHFQTIFSVSFAYLFLGEIFPSSVYFWILLIIVGGILVGVDEKFSFEAFLSQKFFLFLVGLFFLALADIFAKQAMESLTPYNLRFWSSFIIFVLAIPFAFLAKEKIKISRKQYTPVLISGAFLFTAFLFFFRALSYNITISQPLAMFGSLFTFIISVILSKFRPEFLERHSARIYALRGVGVLLMLLSAVIISLT